MIGIAVAYFQVHPQMDPVWRVAIITGFLGALTTFSTFSIEVVSMLQHGRWLLAALTAAGHVGGDASGAMTPVASQPGRMR